MYGELTHAEIEHVLHEGWLGHLGCCDNGVAYVAPITYAYDGTHVYGYTRAGRKLQMMRANPRVCFEVERVDDLANWQTVIAWGVFEELDGEDAVKAEQLIRGRSMGLIAGAQLGLLHGMGGWGAHEASWQNAVRYRLRLTKKSGRFERS